MTSGGAAAASMTDAGKCRAAEDVPHPHPRSPDFMLTGEFGRIRNDLYALLRDEIRAIVAPTREARDAQG